MNGEIKDYGFMEVLKENIKSLYELASQLDNAVKARGEKYFCYGYKEDDSEARCGMSGEMIALIQRTMRIVKRAHKHVLEV